MAISRMQEPQQIQRGIGSLDIPRQNYGLGKLVKKAVRGVKKVVKSPLGKAALLGGGLWASNAFGPTAGWFGKMTQGKGFSGLGGLLKRGATSAWDWSKANKGKAAFLGLGAAATALPFLMKGDEEEDVVEESWTNVPSSIADIRNQAKNYYRNPTGSTLAFMPGKQFVDQNYYAADGGRVGLLNGGEAGQEQIEQILMAEYVKYKNQGGTLSFEEFVQAVMQAQQEQQPEGAGMEQPQEVAMAANGGRMGFKDGKSWWDNFKSGWGQVLSGETEAVMSGDQEKINDFLTEQGWGIDLDPEIIKMIIDGHKKGLDISTISSLAETDEGTVENIIEKLSFANGGRIGYAGGQLVSPSADGSRPGYKGLPNIFITPGLNDKRPPRNKFDFLRTTGPLTDNQKEILQNMTEEDWEEADKGGFVDIIIDILKVPYVARGGKTDQPLFDFANGGPVPGSTVPGYTTPAGHNRFDYYSGGDPVRVGAYAGGLMREDEDEYNYDPQAAMKMYRRPGKQEGGIMETEEASEMIDMGGMEKDYRDTGGFVEIGGKERADDVPARLSKNEFVFTADAVRAAGGGDIDKGSEVMQNMMENLEAGGEISEESQGLEGAQAMYDQQQMLQSRIA